MVLILSKLLFLDPVIEVAIGPVLQQNSHFLLNILEIF